jgi:hypothetical protein
MMISQYFTRHAFCLFCSPHGNEKVIECPTLMQSTIHAYKVRPRKDKRGFAPESFLIGECSISASIPSTIPARFTTHGAL